MKTVLALVALSFALALTTDYLWVAVVASLLNGAAIYLAIRAKLLAA